MRKIDQYYMCHYQKLVERKVYVENVVSKYNIELNWILDYDKEVLDEVELTKSFPFLYSDKNGQKLSKAEISLVMKHYFAFKDTVEKNYENVVVFEDDIILVDDFDKKLSDYINQLPEDYDILWIGTCCNLHVPQTNSNLNVYLNRHGSRCTHAYVISKQGCQKLLDFFHTIYQPIDWYFNTSVRTLNMNNYWAEPPLSTQDLSFNSAIDCGRVE
jgi:GR25 family glycosyltransferase involved in LPS biosynthesis